MACSVISFAADRFVKDELLIRFDDTVSSDDTGLIITLLNGRKTGESSRHPIERIKLTPGGQHRRGTEGNLGM